MPKTVDSSLWLRKLTLALGLLLITTLSYGLLANKMGFFLDDWYIVSTYRVFGVAGFSQYFQGDRPLLSYVYLIFMPIFKDSLLAWQVFAIFTKWLSALIFWILLDMLVPGRRLFNYATALLFGVYPGFKFHYFVIMYSQTYFLLALYFLSYILMLLALKPGKWRWHFTVLALICQFIGIAPMEYFYGLELIRPILLFMVLPGQEQPFGKRSLAAIKRWLPYALVFLAFTAFRVLSSRQFSYQFNLLSDLQSNTLNTLLDLAVNLIQGVFDSCLMVWTYFKEIIDTSEDLRAIILRVGLVGVAGLLSFLLLFLTRKGRASLEIRTPSSIMWLGLASVLAAMVPFLIAGFKVNLNFPFNRFMLPLSVGACVFIVALIEQLFRTQTQKIIILSLLVGLSVGANYLNAREYKLSWERQKDFFAQLTWRAPQIKPNTNLVTTTLPFANYFSGTSLSAPLNLIYAPDNHSNPIPYQIVLVATAERTQLPALVPNQTIFSRLRGFLFNGNTSDMLVVHVPEKGCLRILNSDSDRSIFLNDYDYDLWKEIIPLSNPSRILSDSPQTSLPIRYFGKTSENHWCYFYEKAELANQFKDWAKTKDLYLETQTLGLNPESNDELLPFIRAFSETGNYQTALNLSETLADPDQVTKKMFCDFWIEELKNLSSSNIKDRAINLIKSWHCEVTYHE